MWEVVDEMHQLDDSEFEENLDLVDDDDNDTGDGYFDDPDIETPNLDMKLISPYIGRYYSSIAEVYVGKFGFEIGLLVMQGAQKAKDPTFYFDFCLDDNCTLKHLFWADRRARHDCSKFYNHYVYTITKL